MKKTTICILILMMSVFCGCAWRYVYRAPNNQDEVQYCVTEDGWDIALMHFKPKIVNPKNYPLILCHGLGDNNFIWDIHKDVSFADYLRKQGFDIWVMAFRGSGKSTKPGIVGLSKVMEVKMPDEERYTYDPRKINWNIEDFVDKDLPAVIKYVKDKTGMKKVNLMGHSLGALINAAYIEKYGDKDINAFVSIGIPIIFTHPLNAILREVEKNKEIVRASLLFNLRAGALMGAPVAGDIEAESDILSFNKENMDKAVIANYLSNDIEDISPAIVDQYLAIITDGQCISADRSYNYTANLHKIEVPALFVGGKLDNIATPLNEFYAYYNIKSLDKTIKIFGKQDLCKVDYGHTDLVIGRNAPSEVFPYVSEWLKEHSASSKRKITPAQINIDKEALDLFIRKD